MTGATGRVSLRQLLLDAEHQLLAAGAADDLDDARLQVELLFGEVAGLSRTEVMARGNRAVEPDDARDFGGLISRRLRHEPFAYILGRREFFGLEFAVGPGCLIPRPETETLVEAAIAAIHDHPLSDERIAIVDVGTGSGAIALTVAHECAGLKMIATERSRAALRWAQKNRRGMGLGARVTLVQGDLLEPLRGPLHIVLANLPYVPTEEFERLPPEIRSGEPALAVDGGEDGLQPYAALAAQLPRVLAEGPVALIAEVGAGQTPIVEEWLTDAATSSASGRGVTANVHRDLRGNRRVVEIRAGYP